MINVLTYAVKPYFLHGQPLPFQSRNATEWLRMIVNQLYNTNKARLRRMGINTELFHNHSELTNEPKVRYPLVIYHYFISRFFVTGINEGKDALKELLDPIFEFAEIDKNFLLKFEQIKEEKLEIVNSNMMYQYTLTNWLSQEINTKQHKQFLALPLNEKIKQLETILLKHITIDFGRFLNLHLSETQLSIHSIDDLKRNSIPYKTHEYQPFSIEFHANINLPDFITLGNGKAFGFGRINSMPIL
ncbi:MAG: CRISPR-associated endonuclease Cas6 [Bacteroidota bacterium]